MAFITDTEIAKLQDTLTTREAGSEILANFLPLLCNSFSTVPHSEAHQRPQDPITYDLLQEEFSSWIPLSSRANGNCLFNSASIFLVGNESLSGILRLLTVAELFANSNFYAAHPQIAQFSQVSGYSKEAIFNLFLSDDTASRAYNERSSNATYTIEVLANETARPYVFSSQFHILALSSVINLPIFSVYPDIPGLSAIKKSLHGICIPKEHFLEDNSIVAADPIHIMWTKATRAPLCGWTPNHFAPLVPFRKLSGTASFAEVVERGRKQMQQFSLEKQSVKGSLAKKNQHKKTTPEDQQQQSSPRAQQGQDVLKAQQEKSPSRAQQRQSPPRAQQRQSPPKTQQRQSPHKTHQHQSAPTTQQRQPTPKTHQRPSTLQAQQRQSTP